MISILYEDNHLIAVNKPAGLLSQPSETESESLETAIKSLIKIRDKKSGNVFIGVVHRLDKPVSGVMLFAKTSKALSRLNATIRLKKNKKTYLALVEGKPDKREATLHHFLKQGSHISTLSDEKNGKLAILHYKTIKEMKTATLLEIELETGRYHQIRSQCQIIGCPIIGDLKYGAKKELATVFHLTENTIALHHAQLIFQPDYTSSYLYPRSYSKFLPTLKDHCPGPVDSLASMLT